MTTPGVFKRARAGRRIPAAACAAAMAAVVGGAWAIVPSNDTPASASTPSSPAPRLPAAAAPGAAPAASPSQAGTPSTAMAATDAPPGAPAVPPAAPAPEAQPPAPQPPAWAESLPPAGIAWSPYIDAAAAKEGLDPRLFASLVWAESNFDAAAVSNKGAVGLAQVMPTTAADMGIDPANPLQNLAGGARYLKKNLDRFGRADLALAAYNAGPRTVAETGGVPDIYETVEYVGKVLTFYSTLSDAQGQ